MLDRNVSRLGTLEILVHKSGGRSLILRRTVEPFPIAERISAATNSPNKIDATINANVRTIAVTQPMTRRR